MNTTHTKWRTKSATVRRFLVNIDLLRKLEMANEQSMDYEPIQPAKDYEAQYYRVDDKVRLVINRLLTEVQGVISVRTRQRYFEITIGRIFSWDDFNDQIVAIIDEGLYGATPITRAPDRIDRIRRTNTSSNHVFQVLLSRKLLRVRDDNFESLDSQPLPAPSDTFRGHRYRCDESGRKLVNRLIREVPGVLDVRTRAFEVNVRLAVVVEKKEVENLILAIIQDEVFGGTYPVFEEVVDDKVKTFKFDANAVVPLANLRRIRFKETSAADVRWYGVPVTMMRPDNKQSVDHEPIPAPRDKWAAKHYRITEQARLVINRLLREVPGITEVITRAYEVNIKVSDPTLWEEAHALVVSILDEGLFGGPALDLAAAA